MNTQSNANDDKHTIATYVSDMLALERHIAQPIAAQIKSGEHQQYGEAFAIVARIGTMTDTHIAALEQHLTAIGGHAVSPLKSAWSVLLGTGAAAIDQVRKTKVSKSLRDDYTALGLAAISYTMLDATARGLGDRATALLAKRHLDDIAPLIVEISTSMPAVVLQELRDDGENVDVSAGEISARETGESWKSVKSRV